MTRTALPHLTIRVLGTALVVVLLSAPLWVPGWGPGLIGEIALVPFPGNAAVIGGFLALVALYCLTLQRLVRRAGAGSGASVWWMFAIPANFVEDFFIIRRVADAVAPRTGTRALGWWRLLGYGWCALQIVSLLPGEAGQAGGALAILLWLAQWVLTLSISRRLR
ncbi:MULTISPECIES: hypothetical protein [Agromyces]|jgi:hypothetical protein|uniref:hypothetical protein n=1 Tax=Agromyces TaxID=33877 RepID=UPI001E39DE77|nr:MULTISPECIES: hypothetical protein [Agromyces]MCD1570322.1 hypothetical protein [Agromyces mediolanus]GLU88670.1 hypothetical protein Agsp01_09250 [Agromyces sp. NBRC 114283]